jgi:RNA polymerase sigma-54 factor
MSLQPRQTAQQRLILAPNVTVALEILRMPAMELQTYLRQQAEENPFLDISDPAEAEDGPMAEAPGPEAATETPDAPLSPGEDWLPPWAGNGPTGDPEEDEARQRSIEQRLARAPSLRDSLSLQLACQELPDTLRRLGQLLIEQLDESGYLNVPLEELVGELRAPVPDLEAALAAVQRCDPPGVGARNLRECLLLQLTQADRQESLAGRIVRDQFPLFAQHRLSSLSRALGAAPDEIARACEQIRALNPRPGSVFSGDLPPGVVPDLLVRELEGRYDVELNDHHLPRVTVSRVYQRMLRDDTTPPDAKEFLAGRFRQAAWVIKAIEERNATLLAIGRCLISLQREFLEQGLRALRPLTQAQVAGLIGRNPSTVSRAICGKTMDTPFGVFRLEQLFPSRVPQGAGAAGISDAEIKAQLSQLIAEENPRQPLSDQVLVRRLNERHISVARRTVAKYRASLKILPARLRRLA